MWKNAAKRVVKKAHAEQWERFIGTIENDIDVYKRQG